MTTSIWINLIKTHVPKYQTLLSYYRQLRIYSFSGFQFLPSCFSREGTRCILGWGNAARPLEPWPYFRQKSSAGDFLNILFKKFNPIKDIYQEKIPCLRQLSDKIDTLFKTNIPENNTLTNRTSQLSPYTKGVPSRVFPLASSCVDCAAC